MLTVEQKQKNYERQNNGKPLTPRQQRQLRKTETRLGHQQNHSVLRERQRNARQRLREWMKGIR